MPIGITEEQNALSAAIEDWGDTLGTSVIRDSPQAGGRAGVDGLGQAGGRVSVDGQAGGRVGVDGLAAIWKQVAALGLFSIAVPEELGGDGGSLADVATALEQTGAALVPGPVLPTVLAGVLLSHAAASSPSAAEPLPAIAAGELTAAVALDRGTLTARERDGGGFEVSGSVTSVLCAPSADVLLLGAARADGSGDIWFVAPVTDGAVAVTSTPAFDFSRTIGSVTVTSFVVDSAAALTLSPDFVRDVAVTLAVAEASGVTARCQRIATDYAKVRVQFGKPIGSFQAVKHICADMLCRSEQSAALAWNAARAFDDQPDALGVSAAAAGAVVLDNAVASAKDCIQVLGGIGFTWEHDAHLYLRRATVLRQIFGLSSDWASLCAHRAAAHPDLAVSIDPNAVGGLTDDDVENARRTAETIAALDLSDQRAALAEAGYLAPQWPAPYGLDASAPLQLLVESELRAAGVVQPDLVIAAWALPTIIEHGTDAQKERFVADTMRGSIVWCQLFSEPEAGSDLASLRTTAVRDGDGWRLDGQKVWTSSAHTADWAICLARTDPSAPPHRGITYFLVDMTSPGITVRPLREITGDSMFNEVFLDGVHVPDDCVVGEVNKGWPLTRTTFANERVSMGAGRALGADVARVLAAWNTHGDVDPVTVHRIGSCVAQGLSISMLGTRATLRRLHGSGGPGAESSVQKLLGVEHRQRSADLGLDLLGPDGAATDRESEVAHLYLLNRCLSIAGGSTQILKTIAGERILGLPRG